MKLQFSFTVTKSKEIIEQSFQCLGNKGRHYFKAVNFPLQKQKLFSLLHFSAPCPLCPTVKQLKLSPITSYSSFISHKNSRIFLSHSVTYSSDRQSSPPTATSSRLSNSPSMFIFFLVVFLQFFSFFCDSRLITRSHRRLD